MIKTSEIKKIVNDYSDVKIGVLGSHSALEVMDGAKDEEFQTRVFVKKDERDHIEDSEESQTKSQYWTSSKTWHLPKFKKSFETPAP